MLVLVLMAFVRSLLTRRFVSTDGAPPIQTYPLWGRFFARALVACTLASRMALPYGVSDGVDVCLPRRPGLYGNNGQATQVHSLTSVDCQHIRSGHLLLTAALRLRPVMALSQSRR